MIARSVTFIAFNPTVHLLPPFKPFPSFELPFPVALAPLRIAITIEDHPVAVPITITLPLAI